MIKKYKKRLLVLTMLLGVVILIAGTTYAIFKASSSQNTNNDISTLSCFEVEYSDVTDAITLTNDFPISDAEGLERTPYTFKIKNKCSQYLNIQIGVETLSTSQITPNLIKGVITNKGQTPTNAKLLSDGILSTPLNSGTNYVLLEDTILANAKKEYDLRLWFTETMTKEQGAGKTYQGKVTIISSPLTDPTVYGKVLIDYSRNNGVQKTNDENGKEIYYYTGNISNNNIVLNNFCWKMIRTTETNGVKLLYNGKYTDTNKCNNSADDIEIDKSTFGVGDQSPAYIGYMYNTVYNRTMKSASSFGTYYYGSDVTYSNGTYTLINASSGTISNMYSNLKNKHYSCFTTGQSCTEVYYIFYMESATSYAFSIKLSAGKKITDVLSEMLNDSNVNSKNSPIKDVIDNWYKENMTNVTNKLENTIYCNNREFKNLSASGWNPNGGSVSTYLYFNSDKLTCQNKNDQFTLKVENGGINGYGNNKLDYPVGLLTYKEASLSNPSGFIKSDNSYWTMSPNYFDFYNGLGYYVSADNTIGSGYVLNSFSVRPVISLRNDVIISSGTGKIDNPYLINI
ncbi:MAG: hypothetical protein Q4C44_03240 [bacterium]|nr:hypothetical protein [bacterium]